jgi:DNA-binding transcriptional MerR regulator
MRIAELSTRSGVPVPTIKYYLREGLVPPGELTSPNQAQYDELHLRRLRLIRALVEVGDLSIAETRDVLSSIDSPGKTLHERSGMVQRAVTPALAHQASDESLAAATELVANLVARRGWFHGPGHPLWEVLVQVVATLEELDQEDVVALLDDYADAVEPLAEKELAAIVARREADAVLEGVVVGTILGESLLAVLRRMAHANASARALQQTARVGS